MREHLYRAKRINWRELPKEEWWVEGAVLQSETETRITTSFFSSGESEEGIMAASYLVEPETVCEYTGLQDKNGRKIFENNIVQYCDCAVENYVIAWDLDKALFEYRQYGCSVMNFDELNGMEIEIMGNIFDNTELLQNE